MYRLICSFLIFTFLMVSCNKDDGGNTSQQQEVDAGFFALQVGNVWVYSYFRVDMDTGELIDLGGTETVEITDEEVVNGETIFTMKITTIDENNTCSICNDNPLETKRVKDSLGYLVEVDGPIIFSSTNTDDFLVSSQEFGDIYRVLKPNEVLITVPAGQFVSKDNERYAIDPEGNRYEGQDNLYYAEGIGEIRQTISSVSILKIIFEKQLISYTVQ
ncbi:MAG: hypothetical protein AAF489_05445 [Bacteroidota bacterium]